MKKAKVLLAMLLTAGMACKLLLGIKDLAAPLGATLSLDRPYLMIWACALPLLLAAGYWLQGRRGLRVAALSRESHCQPAAALSRTSLF